MLLRFLLMMRIVINNVMLESPYLFQNIAQRFSVTIQYKIKQVNCFSIDINTLHGVFIVLS